MNYGNEPGDVSEFKRVESSLPTYMLTWKHGKVNEFVCDKSTLCFVGDVDA